MFKDTYSKYNSTVNAVVVGSIPTLSVLITSSSGRARKNVSCF